MATILNVDRSKTYTPVSSTGPFTFDFPVFDGTGADLRVTLGGVVQTGNWTFSGTPDPSAPNTWINCSITFAAAITGTLVIKGRRRPRRTSQYAAGRGIPAQDQNTEWNILTAVDRELFERSDSLESRMDILETSFNDLSDWVNAQIDALTAWVTTQIATAVDTMQALLVAAQAAAAAAANWAADAQASAAILAELLTFPLDMGDQSQPLDPDPFDLGEQGT